MRFAGAKYHLTVRGNGRRQIFFGREDYERFLSQLDEALAADEVILYAYVLMPNHVHLLVETPLGNVQRFMQRLNTAYGMYFRFKHSRPGHCFQGRYGACLVSGDEYLVRLTRYIHLNPIKTRKLEKVGPAGQIADLSAFPWSSYRGYAGLAAPEERVDYGWLSLMGRKTLRGNRAAYRAYAEGMIGSETGDEMLQAALARNSYALGDDRFLEQVKEDQYAARMSKAQTGDIHWPAKPGVPVERVVEAVAREYRTTVTDLSGHGRAVGPAKKVALELCCRLGAASQRAVAVRFGYKHESAVGKQRQLLRRLCESDPSLTRRIKSIAAKVSKC